jgi:HlyD family secretion protein
MTANVTIILARKNEVLIAPLTSLRVRRREIRKVYPEVGKSRRRGPRRSPEESAARARKRFLEGKGSVWVYRNGKPERMRIRFGVTDARSMEIIDGLKEGDRVVVGIKTESVPSQSSRGGRASWIRRRILGGF